MQHEITRVVIMDLPNKANSTSNEKLKQELSVKLNYNSQMFNYTHSHGSNLIDYSDRIIFKKSIAEKEELKRVKKLYKKSLLND